MQYKGLVAVALIAIVGAGIWFGGVRLVSVPPMQTTPEGETLLVSGLHGTALVTSLDAICRQAAVEESDAEDPELCRLSAVLAISREAQVLLHLPYIAALDAK